MGARVLVVDDRSEDLSLATFLLRAFGHEPLQARGAREALDVALQERPDLILMDLLMPELDGYEALELLRAESRLPRTPIVAVTVLTSPERREQALRAGFDGYIPKPILPTEFRAALEGFLVAPRDDDDAQ